MIDQIQDNKQTLAIIVRAGFESEGLSFLTPDDALLQFGHMTRPAGYQILPHIHNPHSRQTTGTQEVIFLKKGRARVDFYSLSQKYVDSRELTTGDWLILLGGGHAFEMLEPTTMIEVKNAGRMQAQRIRQDFLGRVVDATRQ